MNLHEARVGDDVLMQLLDQVIAIGSDSSYWTW